MKAMMSWSEVLSVGDPELDEQHRTLFGMMNSLYDNLTQGKTEDHPTQRKLEDGLAQAISNDNLTQEASDDSLMQRSAEESLSRLLDDLMAYTRYHFRNEEIYFDQFRYDEREIHKQAHRLLEVKVLEYRARQADGDTGIAVELLDFMRDWIIGHIMKMDSRYCSSFSEIVRGQERKPK